MLEKVNLKKTTMREAYKQESAPLKERLSLLQHTIADAGLPVIILFEGWGTAGKGSIISDVILQLDPRHFKVFSTLSATPQEMRMPFLWRHWCRIPARGKIAVLDRSWYPEVSIARIEGDLKSGEAFSRMDSINIFERQLTDDGYVVIKFFLHISQKEQKKRLEKLEQDKSTAWRATKEDWKRNRAYEKYFHVFDEMLEYTDMPYAPWHCISGQDHYTALAEVYRVLVKSIEQGLALRREKSIPLMAETASDAPGIPAIEAGPYALVEIPRLRDVKLDKVLEPDRYKKLLDQEQKKLHALHNRLYLKKVPVVVVYEGWDAAGKGGNIKRLTAALDPRGFEVVPIAAPTSQELAHHYLWRFWEELPKDGHLALFDRSWYGRVMVERIEGFCTREAWMRAYREINEFEKELADRGTILLKFWLHIDKQEQLRRFNDRQNTPEKRWKITEEDWRNREKWEAYEEAVDDMLHYTSTDFAPWTIIESQDKRFARIKAVETLITALKERL